MAVAHMWCSAQCHPHNTGSSPASAGMRASNLHIQPGSKESVQLALVPYHVGVLPLPVLCVETENEVQDVLEGRTLCVGR